MAKKSETSRIDKPNERNKDKVRIMITTKTLTNKQANKRANKQTNKQTNKQPTKQASKQASKQAPNKRTNERTNQPTSSKSKNAKQQKHNKMLSIGKQGGNKLLRQESVCHCAAPAF